MNFYDYINKQSNKIVDNKIEQKDQKKNLNLFSNEDKTNQMLPPLQPPEKSSTSSSKKIRKDPSEYLLELKHKMIKNIKKQWLTPNKEKKYLSVTQVVGCPLQTWFILAGIIKDKDIEEDKIFYLLNFYGKFGDVIHDQIYKLLDLEHKEKTLYDKKHYLRGRFDIIDSNMLIDIKSTTNESNVKDYIPQLALYYHLATINNYKIDRVLIWLVLKDKIIELDIDHLKILIPYYLDASVNIKQALETLNPPKYMNSQLCKYCLVKNFCTNFINQNKLQLIDLSTIPNSTDNDDATIHDDNDNVQIQETNQTNDITNITTVTDKKVEFEL